MRGTKMRDRDAQYAMSFCLNTYACTQTRPLTHLCTLRAPQKYIDVVHISRSSKGTECTTKLPPSLWKVIVAIKNLDEGKPSEKDGIAHFSSFFLYFLSSVFRLSGDPPEYFVPLTRPPQHPPLVVALPS